MSAEPPAAAGDDLEAAVETLQRNLALLLLEQKRLIALCDDQRRHLLDLTTMTREQAALAAHPDTPPRVVPFQRRP